MLLLRFLQLFLTVSLTYLIRLDNKDIQTRFVFDRETCNFLGIKIKAKLVAFSKSFR